MPQMGPMVGYAVTVQIQPGNPDTPKDVWRSYYSSLSDLPGPKVVVIQDLDKPDTYGSFWGEVSANIHRSLGCVGTITDGAIRDVDEMTNAGFKGIARRMCVGHAYNRPVAWGCEIEVFGSAVATGDLVHADKHGFLVVPPEDQPKILHAATFMDRNECSTVIDSARNNDGRSKDEILRGFSRSLRRIQRQGGHGVRSRRRMVIVDQGELINLLPPNDNVRPFKYWPGDDFAGPGYGNDIPDVRYADVLLTRAEALNELRGPNQESIDLINRVRNRAGLEKLELSQFSSKEALREHILNELGWEFWWEGKRREDLIRHGKFIEQAQAERPHVIARPETAHDTENEVRLP